MHLKPLALTEAQPPTLPGPVVLVLQGGGALGAYQWGVYQALHEAGIEPDWVIGTSIGAINGALIAGNARARRLERLDRFWTQVEQPAPPLSLFDQLGWTQPLTTLGTVLRGIPGFFAPNPAALAGPQAELGVENAAWYSAAPLRETLGSLLDLPALARCAPRLTVGAVNVRSGGMRYFDSRDGALQLDHIMASGALPPAFGAVRIDGQPYWDGGLYSNTPIEVVFDDRPRRSALIFAVNLWHADGPEPGSITEVQDRQKDIQYASRADSHIARQKQIHQLRHVIRELARHVPKAPARSAEAAAVAELAAWGCGTVMHVAHLRLPRLAGEDGYKDIDFSHAGVQARRAAGLADARSLLARAPWSAPFDPAEGLIEHV